MASKNSVNGIYKVIRKKPIGINRKILLVANFAKLSKNIIEKNKVNNSSINALKELTALWL